MSLPKDYMRKHFGSQLERSLEQALAGRIGQEFPRIGGPRMQALCAQLVMEVVNDHLRPRDQLRHGQVLWAAINRDFPPVPGSRVAQANLVPVILDLSTPEDIQMLLDRKPSQQRLEHRCVRLCRQAYAQGAVLSDSDLAQLLSCDNTRIASAMSSYEKRNAQLVPRRATVHDVGTAITHKKIICCKRYAEGKNSQEIARETCHTVESVDRFLGQFDRVRHCRLEQMTPEQTAYVLGCSVRLVQDYLDIDRQLENAQGIAPEQGERK